MVSRSRRRDTFCAPEPRIFATDAIYHVYCQTARGELVFHEHEEIERWIDTVALVAEEDGMAVFAWCLLGNHFHMVVQTQGAALFRPMARIQGRVAKGLNRRNGWTGRLWQSRYKARLVTTHRYLRHLFAYVHLNPVAAGLVVDPTMGRPGTGRCWASRSPGLSTLARHSCAFGRILSRPAPTIRLPFGR